MVVNSLIFLSPTFPWILSSSYIIIDSIIPISILFVHMALEKLQKIESQVTLWPYQASHDFSSKAHDLGYPFFPKKLWPSEKMNFFGFHSLLNAFEREVVNKSGQNTNFKVQSNYWFGILNLNFSTNSSMGLLGVITSRLIHLIFNYRPRLVGLELTQNICEGRGIPMVLWKYLNKQKIERSFKMKNRFKILRIQLLK